MTKAELQKLIEAAQEANTPLLMPVEFYQQHAEQLNELYAEDSSLLDESTPSLPELRICGPAQNVQCRNGRWEFVADRLPISEQGQ